MTQPFTTFDGAIWPVTERWYGQYIAPFPDLANFTEGQLEQERDRLNVKSRKAYWPEDFTDEDGARKEAIGAVLDLDNARRWLHGRPLDEFGFEGLDQVKGNALIPGCGCYLYWVVDHYAATGNDPLNAPKFVHHPGRVCECHADLAKRGFEAHSKGVIEAAQVWSQVSGDILKGA